MRRLNRVLRYAQSDGLQRQGHTESTAGDVSRRKLPARTAGTRRLPFWDAAPIVRLRDLNRPQVRRGPHAKPSAPGRNRVVIWIVRILEPKPSNVSRPCISRDDVQMDVPVLVLEEGIVEMV